jgi:hypothetical protein
MFDLAVKFGIKNIIFKNHDRMTRNDHDKILINDFVKRTIKCISEPGQGTRFIIRIPVNKDDLHK